VEVALQFKVYICEIINSDERRIYYPFNDFFQLYVFSSNKLIISIPSCPLDYIEFLMKSATGDRNWIIMEKSDFDNIHDIFIKTDLLTNLKTLNKQI
jgi:hypothetical protein